MLFFSIYRPCGFIWRRVGWLVGGCRALAVSRKTPIYFICNLSYYGKSFSDDYRGLIDSTRNFSLGFRCTTCFGWDADDDAVDGCWKPQSSIDLWNENTNCLKLQSSEKLLLGCTTLSHKCNILPISNKTILNPTTINLTTTKQQRKQLQQQNNPQSNNNKTKTETIPTIKRTSFQKRSI